MRPGHVAPMSATDPCRRGFSIIMKLKASGRQTMSAHESGCSTAPRQVVSSAPSVVVEGGSRQMKAFFERRISNAGLTPGKRKNRRT
jgi:hypothetical protein